LNRSSLYISALLLFCATAAAAQVTVIKAGKLVRPDDGTVANDQLILIRANRIEAAGTGRPFPPMQP